MVVGRPCAKDRPCTAPEEQASSGLPSRGLPRGIAGVSNPVAPPVAAFADRSPPPALRLRVGRIVVTRTSELSRYRMVAIAGDR